MINVKFSPLSYRLRSVSIVVLQHSYCGFGKCSSKVCSCSVWSNTALYYHKECNKQLTVHLLWLTISQIFSPMENIPACIPIDHLVNVLWQQFGIFDSETFSQYTEAELLVPYNFTGKMQILWRQEGIWENQSFEHRHLHFIYIPFSVTESFFIRAAPQFCQLTLEQRSQ